MTGFGKNAKVISSQADYVKPSNTQAGGRFGWSVALSNDGTELAVGSEGEASSATGVGITSADTSDAFAGATYIFAKSGATWSQSAYIKASDTSLSNAGAVYVFTPVAGTWAQTAYVKAPFAHPDDFGTSVGITNGAAALVVGGIGDPSTATGIGGDPSLSGASLSGAAYTFK